MWIGIPTELRNHRELLRKRKKNDLLKTKRILNTEI